MPNRSVMTLKPFSLCAAAAVLIASAPRDLPTRGHYTCALGAQGSCGQGTDGICLGNRIRVNRPHPITLDVDFANNRLELNGIEGRLSRTALTSARVDWDLAVLGQPTISWLAENDLRIITVRNGSPTADFYCQTR